MALKPCRECKKDVSTEAKTCPHCGVSAPTKQPPSKLGWVALGLFAVVCTAAIAGSGKRSVEASPVAVESGQLATPSPSVMVTATPESEPLKSVVAFTESERKVLRMLLTDELTAFANGGDTLARRVQGLTTGELGVTADELQRAYDANEVAADQKYRNKKLLVRGTVDSINRSIGDSHFVTLRGGSNMFNHPNAKMADGHTSYLAQLAKGQKVVLACDGEGMLIGSAMLSDCVPLERWVEDAVTGAIERLPEVVAGGAEGAKMFVTSIMAVAVIVPPESQCWARDMCSKEVPVFRSKVATTPGLTTRIADRLGVPEDEAKMLLSEQTKKR